MKIFCCKCQVDVEARLTNGGEVYPHRNDLKQIPFWVCDTCFNFVGCHHKSEAKTRPLGVIPTKEIKSARIKIHNFIDPLWKNKVISRKDLYKKLSIVLGRTYHTADIRNLQEAQRIISTVEMWFWHFYNSIDKKQPRRFPLVRSCIYRKGVKND